MRRTDHAADALRHILGAVPVVERLELVPVDHQRRHRHAVPSGSRDLLFEALVEVAVIEQADGTAGDRLVLHALVETRAFDGPCGLLAQGGGQLALFLRERREARFSIRVSAPLTPSRNTSGTGRTLSSSQSRMASTSSAPE